MSLLLFPEKVCNNVVTFGGNSYLKRTDGTRDGSWRVCRNRALSKKCTAYSFGIGWDWSFDDEIAQYCKVFSFDLVWIWSITLGVWSHIFPICSRSDKQDSTRANVTFLEAKQDRTCILATKKSSIYHERIASFAFQF